MHKRLITKSKYTRTPFYKISCKYTFLLSLLLAGVAEFVDAAPEW